MSGDTEALISKVNLHKFEQKINFWIVGALCCFQVELLNVSDI